ncbi:hypothetical protein [Bradyrhizobium sp. DASA03120]|uniref:hypothetical protein n=1 Tax=Bradyrhizobium sp. SMVTL-02 TaxID=3395917 RepID=UPI003F71E5BD
MSDHQDGHASIHHDGQNPSEQCRCCFLFRADAKDCWGACIGTASGQVVGWDLKLIAAINLYSLDLLFQGSDFLNDGVDPARNACDC